MLSVVCHDQKVCLEQYENKLNQIIGLKWQYYYLYKAELPHMLALDDQNQAISVLLKTMKARKVEEYSNNSLISITAYSARLKEDTGVNINGKKYNLQIAIRNNKNNTKTNVYIGSPLILVEY